MEQSCKNNTLIDVHPYIGWKTVNCTADASNVCKEEHYNQSVYVVRMVNEDRSTGIRTISSNIRLPKGVIDWTSDGIFAENDIAYMYENLDGCFCDKVIKGVNYNIES